MAPAKKVSSSKAPKKAATRSAPTHPSWTDMIKECIAAHPEDARVGVSRPQIKKFVGEKYKLDIGNAQNTQLSKAIAVGAEKNTFSLPKGPSGRVKLAPKTPKVADDAKENKPASKTSRTATKTVPKPATKPGSRTKTVTGKSATTKPSSGRKAPSSKTSPPKALSSTRTVKKHVPPAKPPKTSGRTSTTRSDSALKKTYAGKKLPAEKKVKSSTSKGTAKKAATGVGSTSRASKSKAASTKKASSKAASTSRTSKSSKRT